MSTEGRRNPLIDPYLLTAILPSSRFPFLHPLVDFQQLSHHSQALRLLALSLRDPLTSEAYCTQGGELIPAHLGRTLAMALQLGPWAELGGIGATKRRMTVSKETRKVLLMELVRIYLGQGEGCVQNFPRFFISSSLSLFFSSLSVFLLV